MQNKINDLDAFLKQNSDQLSLTQKTLSDVSSRLSAFISQMSAVQERFDRSCKLLFESYEQYMQNVTPSPFLLPVSITIRLRGRRQFWELQLKATDFMGSILEFVQKKILNN